MTEATLIGPVSEPDVHVMTFNVRRRTTTSLPGSPDRWKTRKPLVRRLLRAEQPTLLGVQEALAVQVDAVADALGPRYRWVGHGRGATGTDEHCAIFYDADRLELTAWRQRALSATPDIPGSRSFGNLTRRIVVSAEFADTTGARLLAFNTHLDHLSWRSRLASAAMILDLVRRAESADPDAAIVVTGDFNAGAGSAVTRRLTAEGALRDAWDAASERLTPPWGTYSNYRAPRPGGSRIDRILVGRRVDVLRAGVNATRFDGRAASDHEPMQAVLRPAIRPTI
ncbi:MAG TPA: endonuclease/exonuclease/phosphatase family protein [Microbacterium sp.]|uniref:endonuclease/exonuclease/phosphatase family protein n=1 Tax=Microbacterium sp. TaxID=51671 RepID=UPI002F93657D